MRRALMVVATLMVVAAFGTYCSVDRPGAGDDYQKPLFKHALTTDPCTKCHEKDRPAAFLDQPHGASRICSDCHTSKDDNSGWLPRIPYSHDPVPKSCFDCHIKERPPPPHPDQGQCAGCHAYPTWQPS